MFTQGANKSARIHHRTSKTTNLSFKKESVVEVKVSREKVIIGDSKPWDKSGEKFRDL